MKVSKWVMALLAALYVLSAVLFVMSGNWSALIWEMGAVLFAIKLERVIRMQNKIIERRDALIDELMNDFTYENYVFAERRAACLLKNVRRYQLANQKLRDENKQLKTLAHNLVNHYNDKGRRNYGCRK